MKKILLLCFVITYSINIFSEEHIIPLFNHIDSIKSYKFNETWREQCDYAMQTDGIILDDGNAIKLVDYNFRCSIETDEQCDEFNNIILKPEYTLGFWGPKCQLLCSKDLELLYSVSKKNISLINKGCQVIDLLWEYNGNRIPSIAIADKNGSIIFDAIGYNYPYYTNRIVRDSVGVFEPHFLRTQTDETSSLEVFDYEINIFGELLFAYRFNVTSFFDKQGNYIDDTYVLDNRCGTNWVIYYTYHSDNQPNSNLSKQEHFFSCRVCCINEIGGEAKTKFISNGDLFPSSGCIGFSVSTRNVLNPKKNAK